MLPDFRKAKQTLERHLANYMRQAEARELGFLSDVARHRMFEGDRFSYETVDGKVVSSECKVISESLVLTAEETRSADIGLLRRKIDDTVASMASKRKEDALAMLEQITAETGNVVDAQGRFSAEHLLQLFEMVDIDFDDSGNPRLSGITILVPPNARETVVRAFAAANGDVQLRKRLGEILDRKRELWRDREAGRKLV